MDQLTRFVKKYYHVAQSAYGGVKYSNPAKGIKIIAVTGTSGKSTTATMIFHVLKESGFKVGLISTVGAVAGEETIDTGFHVTTPDPLDLQRILRKMKDKQMEYVVVEASSHSMDQGRFGFMKFDFGVFTNIKRDHLDWHGTWEKYAGAKAKVIAKTKTKGHVVINKDDEESYNFLTEYYKELNKDLFRLITYSLKEEVKVFEESIKGIEFNYKDVVIKIPVFGLYNIENAMAAIKVAEKLGISVKTISDKFKTFKGITGRMQLMQENPVVIVDFAHNTDSLVRSLEAAKKLVKADGKLISVFGSAGLRDVEKRFKMGEASAKLADITIITAEDPRIESLKDINTEIIRGAKSAGGNLAKRFSNNEEYMKFRQDIPKYLFRTQEVYAFDEESVNSRYDAIDFAIKIAGPNDVIITEGKGHEQSLCFGTVEYPFTDQEAVERALQ